MLSPPDGKRDDYYVSTLLAHTLLTLENYAALKELVSGGFESVTVNREHVLKAIEWRHDELMASLDELDYEPEQELKDLHAFFKGCNDICPQPFLTAAVYMCSQTLDGQFQIIQPKFLLG